MKEHENEILYIDQSHEIDYESLPGKIPISYKSIVDFIEHITITCPMLDTSIAS